MESLSENQLLVYKRCEGIKTRFRKKSVWSKWRYICPYNGRYITGSNEKELALNLAKENSLLKKLSDKKIISLVTDNSITHNEIGFNGTVHFYESGLDNSELATIYFHLCRTLGKKIENE